MQAGNALGDERFAQKVTIPSMPSTWSRTRSV
jgi:hypothetical protein